MEIDSAEPAAVKLPLPEIEIFCYLIVLIFLIDQKKYDEVMFNQNYIGLFHFS